MEAVLQIRDSRKYVWFYSAKRAWGILLGYIFLGTYKHLLGLGAIFLAENVVASLAYDTVVSLEWLSPGKCVIVMMVNNEMFN